MRARTVLLTLLLLLPAIATAVESVPPWLDQSGLLAYLPFGPGGAFDASGNGRNGSLSLVDDVEGHLGRGVMIAAIGTGSADPNQRYISIPHDDALALPGDFTVMFWLRLAADDDATIPKYLLNKAGFGNYDGCGLILHRDARTLDVFSGSSFAATLVNVDLPVATWTHVALSRSGTAVSVWIDGQPRGGGTCTGAFAPGGRFGNRLLFGAQQFPSGAYAQGLRASFDECAIFARALGGEELSRVVQDGSSNRLPSDRDQTAWTPVGQALTFTLAGSDADGDGLTYAIVTPPSEGTAVLGTGGAVTWFPPSGRDLATVLTWKANDGHGWGAVATATLTAGRGWVTALGSGLAGQWPMDEGSGTSTADLTGLHAAGTINGATWTTGRDGSPALAFTGNQNVRIESVAADQLGGGTYAISLWTQRSGTNPDNQMLFSKSSGSGWDLALYAYGNLLTMGFSAASSPLPSGWVHIAINRTPAGVSYYVNGRFDGDSTSLRDNGMGSGNPLWIGGVPRTADGAIDDVRLFARVLNPAEIYRLAGVNNVPIALDANLIANGPTPIDLSTLSADADGDALSYTVTAPAHGVLAGSGANRTYTPTVGFTGMDAFTLSVSDGRASSRIATVRLAVGSVPRRGDLNRDGVVDADDLGLVRGRLGQTSGSISWDGLGDADGDGRVDAQDLHVVCANQGP